MTTSEWQAATNITAVLNSDPVTLGTLTADAAGRASASFRIPAGVPAGSHTLELSGIGAGGMAQVQRTGITVTGPAGGGPLSGSVLSRTGAEVFRLLWNGAALALAGALLLVTAARRPWAARR